MLKNVIDWIAVHRPECLDAFRDTCFPSATGEQLEEFEAKFGLSLPQVLKDAYRMANGMRRFSNLSLWRLLTLEEIKTYSDAMIGQTVFDDRLTEYNWMPSWLPFAMDRTGDWAITDLRNDLTSDEVPDFFNWSNVFVLRHDENCLRELTGSLDDWASVWIDDMVELDA